MEGSFTRLSMTEELRCHIAAVYGRGYVNQKSLRFGSPNANDVALRCAYYACGDITDREMKAGYERDKEVYVFAATFNSHIMTRRNLRKLFEEWVRTFAVITVPANELVGSIHDRMPAILKPENYDCWLGVEPDPRELMISFPAELMTMWPISTRVNKPDNDDASLLDRVAGL